MVVIDGVEYVPKEPDYEVLHECQTNMEGVCPKCTQSNRITTWRRPDETTVCWRCSRCRITFVRTV